MGCGALLLIGSGTFLLMCCRALLLVGGRALLLIYSGALLLMRLRALLLVSCDALLLMRNCTFLHLDGVAGLLHSRGALLLLACAALLLVRGDSLILSVALLAGGVVASLCGHVTSMSRGEQSPSQAESRHQGGRRFHLSRQTEDDNCVFYQVYHFCL